MNLGPLVFGSYQGLTAVVAAKNHQSVVPHAGLGLDSR